MITPLLGIVAQLALSSPALGPVDRFYSEPLARRSSDAVVASDSIEITNQHPHTMKVALVSEKGETAIGEIAGGEVKKFAIVLPQGAKVIVLRAFNPEETAMEVSAPVPIDTGKPLKWTVLVG